MASFSREVTSKPLFAFDFAAVALGEAVALAFAAALGLDFGARPTRVQVQQTKNNQEEHTTTTATNDSSDNNNKRNNNNHNNNINNNNNNNNNNNKARHGLENHFITCVCGLVSRNAGVYGLVSRNAQGLTVRIFGSP